MIRAGSRTSKFYLYRNLHTGDWSVMQRGLVIDHVQTATLQGVEFRVRESGHARVVIEGRKNVHAFAVAESYEPGSDPEVIRPEVRVEVTYDPYRGPSFYRKDTLGNVSRSDLVILGRGGLVIAESPTK